jgi:hypothetical protein
MKKATQKSSPSHRSSDQYSKDRSSRKGGAKGHTPGCDLWMFDEHVLLHTLKTGQRLEQLQVIGCPAGCTHTIDIAPLAEKLRNAGHSVVDVFTLAKGAKGTFGDGIIMTREYAYIDTTSEAAND